MRQSLIMGNWKMNGSLESAKSLCSAIMEGLKADDTGIAVCAPYVYLPTLQDLTANSTLSVGAQNVADQTSGAYTGEISATMLKEMNCHYALVGHSERRSYYGDTDQSVADRFCEAQKEGIIPVLCIGETLAEREANETFNVVNRQLDAVIEKAGIEALENAVIAYEPVWAIGTGVTASDEQAQEVHKAIRARIAAKNTVIADKIQILYGGSMKPANAKGLLAMADIDGGLIGGASLDATSFLEIYRSI
ncbi:MAG: triose-phosphate isomerase [Methylococcales bacterium]|nr:triose-phosphate isomerase [Methylococcales bacterium]